MEQRNKQQRSPPTLPTHLLKKRARGVGRFAGACLGVVGAALAAATLLALVLTALTTVLPPFSDDAPAAEAVQSLGTAPAAYGVAGGYFRLQVDHAFPIPGPAAKLRYRASAAAAAVAGGNATATASCLDLAKAVEEPYSEAHYAPRRAPPQPLPGGVPRVAWRWRGRIDRALFDSVPFLLRDGRGAGCHHCTFALRYRVVGGRLYVDSARRGRDLMGQREDVEIIEEMMLCALHMFEIPDVDLLVHPGDGAPRGFPLLQPNIDRSMDRAGFAIPARRAWRDAMGPGRQARAFQECVEVRYPRDHHQGGGGGALGGGRRRRLQRAVWRGSATDRSIDPVDEGTALDVLRARLHLYSRWYPDAIDARLTGFPQRAFDSLQCVESMLPLAEAMPLEDVGRYAIALDADGNGWSDRLRTLALANTPILKQATNVTGFWEHLLPPKGVAMETFSPDASDLPLRARELLAEGATEEGAARLDAMAARAQGVATLALTQPAVIEAMAFAMAKAAELQGWRTSDDDASDGAAGGGYELVPFSRCCRHASALPRRFVELVRATVPAQQQQQKKKQQQQTQLQQTPPTPP